jgi:hypothetical protein
MRVDCALEGWIDETAEEVGRKRGSGLQLGRGGDCFRDRASAAKTANTPIINQTYLKT